MFLFVNVFSVFIFKTILLIIECKYVDKYMTSTWPHNILISSVCVSIHISIHVCICVCVCVQRCMHMLHYILFIGYCHTDSYFS